jgi:hypothetical protein
VLAPQGPQGIVAEQGRGMMRMMIMMLAMNAFAGFGAWVPVAVALLHQVRHGIVMQHQIILYILSSYSFVCSTKSSGVDNSLCVHHQVIP